MIIIRGPAGGSRAMMRFGSVILLLPAHDIYGVCLDPDGPEINAHATFHQRNYLFMHHHQRRECVCDGCGHWLHAEMGG